VWIDIHAHLDRLSGADLAAVTGDAQAAGVTTILSTATDLKSSESVTKHCMFPSVYGALGISPFDAGHLPDNWEQRLDAMLCGERIIAAGEIGLDASNPRYPSLEIQLPVFEKQLVLAIKHDMPVVVHSRGIEKKTAGICRSLGVCKALFHCFTGDADALKTILDNGYYISISGIITWSEALRKTAAAVPLDRLFIETDTPYLAPVPHRGAVNQPAWVRLVGEAVCRCRDIDPGKLQTAIAQNFRRLFA
jgi:TatD DNase family protein